MSLSQSLSVLIEDGILEEVHGRIMIGKEAEVYAVRFQGRTVAAKVYKLREHRSFKNNAAYLEGRSGGRDSRTRRAIEKGSAFGRTVAERDWKEMEHQALQIGFHIGVRVPEPILLYENTLLMEMVVDDEGHPAPRMSDLSFESDQAVELYREVFEQVRRLLGAHRIHGDLSPYNILMGTAGPTLIDLPQVIDAASNPGAPRFLERDLRSVVEYLARFAPRLQAFAGCGAALWQHYRLGTLDAADPMHAPAASRERTRGSGAPQRVKLASGREEVILSAATRAPRGVVRDGRAQARAGMPPTPPARQHPREPAQRQTANPQLPRQPQAGQRPAHRLPEDRQAQPQVRQPQAQVQQAQSTSSQRQPSPNRQAQLQGRPGQQQPQDRQAQPQVRQAQSPSSRSSSPKRQLQPQGRPGPQGRRAQPQVRQDLSSSSQGQSLSRQPQPQGRQQGEQQPQGRPGQQHPQRQQSQGRAGQQQPQPQEGGRQSQPQNRQAQPQDHRGRRHGGKARRIRNDRSRGFDNA